MSITAARPFKGRQYSGEVILTAVRWYLRYPLAYEHVAELLAELFSRHELLRRRLYDASGDLGHAEAEEWLHPSDIFGRWQVGGSWKRSLSRGQMGCRWLHRSHCPRTGAFGVKVCALEPGGMRTNWGKRANAGTPKVLPDYEASVGTFIKMLQGHWGHEMSAPAKVAQVILQLASKEQLSAHLLLGSDAVQYARLAEEKRETDAKAWHNISVSTDAEDVKGLPDLKF
jgi:hypothetical protein